MDSIIDMLQSRLAGDEAARLGEQVGADPSTTQKAVQAALPALVAALAGNARRPEGAANLARALEKDHDGSILGDVTDAAGKLGGLLNRKG